MSNTEQLTTKMASLSIEQLGEIAASLFDDKTAEGGIVFDEALNALESKMSEDDFIRFCNKLAA